MLRPHQTLKVEDKDEVNNSEELTVKLKIVKLEASRNLVLLRKKFIVEVECQTFKLK